MANNLTPEQYRQLKARDCSEEQLQNLVLAQAKRLGFLSYHTHDSRRSAPGYPDLHMVNPKTNITLFRELKSQTGKLRPAQREWLNALRAAGHDTAVWRPIDWFDGTITRELTEHRHGANTTPFETPPSRGTRADRVIHDEIRLMPWQRAAVTPQQADWFDQILANTPRGATRILPDE